MPEVLATPLIVAVDARPLTSPLTGVARVISEVIKNFPDAGNFRFRLYANRPCHEDFQELLDLAHVEWHTSTGLFARKGGLWFNASLPLLLRRPRHKADLFWGSQQILPPFLPRALPSVLTYYDLVLYFFPGAMRPIARLQQRAFQAMSVRRAAYILSISRQTMEDMCAHFDYPKEQAGVSLLGYRRVPHTKRDLQALEEMLGFRPAQNYILAVSTIEPRKNYSVLLEAYARHVKKEGTETLPLVLAGRRGWESPAFYERLQSLESELGSRLTILSGLTEGTLDALYSYAAFFCMPSLYEGFGLPVLEALAHGKCGIVSDLPCFHEIGDNFVRYVPSRDVSAWQAALREFEPLFRKHAGKGGYPPGLKDPAGFPTDEWSWERTARAHYESFCHTLNIEL